MCNRGSEQCLRCCDRSEGVYICVWCVCGNNSWNVSGVTCEVEGITVCVCVFVCTRVYVCGCAHVYANKGSSNHDTILNRINLTLPHLPRRLHVPR